MMPCDQILACCALESSSHESVVKKLSVCSSMTTMRCVAALVTAVAELAVPLLTSCTESV